MAGTQGVPGNSSVRICAPSAMLRNVLMREGITLFVRTGKMSPAVVRSSNFLYSVIVRLQVESD